MVQLATPVEVRERALLVTINQLYSDDMTPHELYEATRGFWVVGPRRDKVELVLAVFEGVVREVYRVRAWHPAGTTQFRTRDAKRYRGTSRWEFEGGVAIDVRDRYIGRSVGKGGQNPVRYVNVD